MIKLYCSWRYVMESNDTILFDTSEVNYALIKETLADAVEAL